MKKYTFKKDGVNCISDVSTYGGMFIGNSINRLAAYEDTGLTPEEIMDGKLLTG